MKRGPIAEEKDKIRFNFFMLQPGRTKNAKEIYLYFAYKQIKQLRTVRIGAVLLRKNEKRK